MRLPPPSRPQVCGGCVGVGVAHKPATWGAGTPRCPEARHAGGCCPEARHAGSWDFRFWFWLWLWCWWLCWCWRWCWRWCWCWWCWWRWWWRRFSPTHGGGSPRDSQHELGRINNATKVVSAVVFVAAFVLLFAFSYPKLSPSSAWPLTLHYQSALGFGVRALKFDLQMYVTPMFVCIKPQHRGYFWQMPIL